MFSLMNNAFCTYLSVGLHILLLLVHLFHPSVSSHGVRSAHWVQGPKFGREIIKWVRGSKCVRSTCGLSDRRQDVVREYSDRAYVFFPRSISILWLGVQRKEQSHLVPCTKLLIDSPFLGFVLFTSLVSKSKCSNLHGKVLIGCFSRHLYIYIKLRETMDTILRTLPN